MHRSHRAPARALLVALGGAAFGLAGALGCGGPDGQDAPELAIAFESRSLLEEANLIGIFFYETPRACTSLRASLPRPPAFLGPYEVTLDEASRANGTTLKREDIPAGSYTVLADAYTPVGGVAGTGCGEMQVVLDRRTSRIQLVVTRNP